MIKKVRRRFILAGMAATFAMTLTLILALNLVNAYFTDQRLGEAISEISDYWEENGCEGLSRQTEDLGLYTLTDEGSLSSGEQSGEEDEDGSPGRQNKRGKNSSGHGNSKKAKNHTGRMGAFAQYQGRAFSLFLSDEGGYKLNGFNKEILTGIDPEGLLDSAQKGGKTEGTVDDFRFLVRDLEGGTLYVFLDCLTEVRAQRTLWAISFAIALLGLAGAFLFISHMSGRSTRPLEESLEKQKRFITDAGHELKTPLSVIGTNMDVLSLDLGENEWVDGTKRQVKKLRKLVANLVTLSRMEEDAFAPALETFDLSGAAEECVTPFADLALSKGKYLHQELEDGLSINGDEAAVRQLITILCDNAVKYASPEEEILVRLYRGRKKAFFETRNAWDHAVPARELDHLFDRFYRADSSRDRGGSQDSYGLGLSIAMAIAEKNHISLKAFEDEKGRLTFQAVFRS